jgi:A/G-specific adenine glycosylase
MKERTTKDIWSGLYDFYYLEENGFLSLEEVAVKHTMAGLLEDLNFNKESAIFTHILTHQRVFAKFWHLRLGSKKNQAKIASALGISFYTPQQIKDLPKPVLINKYLNENFF